MSPLLIPVHCETEAELASLDTTSECLHQPPHDKYVIGHNLELNGTHFAHIITLRLVHAPPCI